MIDAGRGSALPLVDLSALPAARPDGRRWPLAGEEAARGRSTWRAARWCARPCCGSLAASTCSRSILHHIVADAWSVGVLVRELAALYGSATVPGPPVRRACRSCPCSMRTTQSGSGGGSRGRRWRRVSTTGAAAWPGRRRCSSCRPTGRARRCRRCAAPSSRCDCRPACSARLKAFGRAAGGDPLHGPARRLRGAAGALLGAGGRAGGHAGGGPRPRRRRRG